MAPYDFTLVLSAPTELTEEFADKLFAAGCDDSTPSSSEGTGRSSGSAPAGTMKSARPFDSSWRILAPSPGPSRRLPS